MNHDAAFENLSAYLDGILSDSEAAELNSHVASCDECRETLDGLRSVQTAVASLPSEKAPAGFAAAVMSEVRQPVAAGGGSASTTRKPSARVISMQNWLMGISSVAAALLVVVVATSIFDDHSIRPEEPVRMFGQENAPPATKKGNDELAGVTDQSRNRDFSNDAVESSGSVAEANKEGKNLRDDEDGDTNTRRAPGTYSGGTELADEVPEESGARKEFQHAEADKAGGWDGGLAESEKDAVQPEELKQQLDRIAKMRGAKEERQQSADQADSKTTTDMDRAIQREQELAKGDSAGDDLPAAEEEEKMDSPMDAEPKSKDAEGYLGRSSNEGAGSEPMQPAALQENLEERDAEPKLESVLAFSTANPDTASIELAKALEQAELQYTESVQTGAIPEAVRSKRAAAAPAPTAGAMAQGEGGEESTEDGFGGGSAGDGGADGYIVLSITVTPDQEAALRELLDRQLGAGTIATVDLGDDIDDTAAELQANRADNAKAAEPSAETRTVMILIVPLETR